MHVSHERSTPRRQAYARVGRRSIPVRCRACAAGSRTFGLQWSIVEKAAATVERIKRDRAASVEGGVRSGMARDKESVECTEEIEVKCS